MSSTTTTIGLIPGTGKQSQGIALRLGLAGYNKILIGSRSAEKAQTIAKELNAKLGKNIFQGFENKEVVRNTTVLFLVVPAQFLNSTLTELGPEFQSGTILVDVTVPLSFKEKRICWDATVINSEESPHSASEFIQEKLPKGVTVVGAFKTISAAKLNALEEPLEVSTFLVSDSQEAKTIVKNILIKIPGLQILDAGPLAVARTIEHMTALVINLNKLNKLKHGSFKIVAKKSLKNKKQNTK